MGHSAHVKVRGQLIESVLSFHYVRPRVRTWVVKLDSKHLYPQPCFWFEEDLTLKLKLTWNSL